jgi:hypothetical protein
VSRTEVEHDRVIDGKEDAHDDITDAHPPCQDVVSHEGQCSDV